MNDIKKINDNIPFSTPLPSKEVENVIKNTTQQAQRINSLNENIVSSIIKDKENKFSSPILRAPIEQKKNNQRINIQDDVQYKINVFPQQNIKSNNKNISQDKQSSPEHYDISNPQSNKSTKEYDFLYLQLSYQNVIHQNILDKIKDLDKLDYYIDKLNKLSKGIDGLREQFKSAIKDFENNKAAYIDYWMEVYNQIKENKFKTKAEVEDFIKNNNIPKSLIKALLSGNIKSKNDMEKLLENVFPFLKLPDDLSQLSLDALDKLYSNLSQFFDNIFKSMPDISISDDKINTITSHKDELKALINKTENESIKKQLEQIKETYRALTSTQSALELEIMSNSLSGMALLTFLLAKTRELTLKVMLQRSEFEQKLFEGMQEVTEKSLKEKIEDQKAQIRKQEEIQFWAGIGLKLLAGLLAIVAGVASIFTAGASMALMAVAAVLMVADIALTIADEVYQAIHETSFMDELMQPLTEAIMEALDKIADLLVEVIYSLYDGLNILAQALGIDKEIINDIKNLMRDKLKMSIKMLITAALFVAAVALSFIVGPAANGITSAVKKIINQQIRTMLKRIFNEALELMMGKMLKEIIVQVFEEVMEKISKLLAKEIAHKASIMLNRTVVISKLINATATNAVNIYSSTISAKIMQSIADSKKLNVIFDLIQKLMDKIMESYNENTETITEILKNMSEQSSISNRTKSDMIRNISI